MRIRTCLRGLAAVAAAGAIVGVVGCRPAGEEDAAAPGERATSAPATLGSPSGSTGSTSPSPSPSSPSGPAPTGAAAVRTVVGLGDSVTAGANCRCDDFVSLLARKVAARAGTPVEAVNLGVGGQTTGGLLTRLSDPDAAAAVRRADVVLVTIGANDLLGALRGWPGSPCVGTCRQRLVDRMQAGLDGVLARVRVLAGPAAVVLVTDYWNVYADGDVARRESGQAFVDYGDAMTRLANAAILDSAARLGAVGVDLYAPFKGRDGDRDPTDLLSDDGDHPAAAGHEVIARELLRALG